MITVSAVMPAITVCSRRRRGVPAGESVRGRRVTNRACHVWGVGGHLRKPCAYLVPPRIDGMARAHVLVVEDDDAIGTELTEALVGQGYEAGWAADGRQALDMAGRVPPELILL